MRRNIILHLSQIWDYCFPINILFLQLRQLKITKQKIPKATPAIKTSGKNNESTLFGVCQKNGSFSELSKPFIFKVVYKYDYQNIFWHSSHAKFRTGQFILVGI